MAGNIEHTGVTEGATRLGDARDQGEEIPKHQEMPLSGTLSANVIAIDMMKSEGLTYGSDFAQMAMVHDEFQFETMPGNAEILGQSRRCHEDGRGILRDEHADIRGV